MSRVLAVSAGDFHGQTFRGGTTRGTAEAIFQEHGAQINLTRHPPGLVVAPHSHSVDEVLYLLDGDLRVDGGGVMGQGSALVFGAHNVYGFTVGDKGVRWLAIRPVRPDVGGMDQTDASYTAAEGEHPRNRSHAVSAEAIEAAPWQPIENGLAERPIADPSDGPRMALLRVSSRDPIPRVPVQQHRFLFVLEGLLRVGEDEWGPESIIPAPPGATFAFSAAGPGPATCLLVESDGGR